jgi:hypothetical protein
MNYSITLRVSNDDNAARVEAALNDALSLFSTTLEAADIGPFSVEARDMPPEVRPLSRSDAVRDMEEAQIEAARRARWARRRAAIASQYASTH